PSTRRLLQPGNCPINSAFAPAIKQQYTERLLSQTRLTMSCAQPAGFARMSGRRIRGLVTAVSPIDGMPPSAAVESFAVRRRRESRREEWREQMKLSVMLDKYLPDSTFWTSLR